MHNTILTLIYERSPIKDQLVLEDIIEKVGDNKTLINTLTSMQNTDGEPAIVAFDGINYTVFDCAKETPKSRTSVCYDEEARLARTKFPPETSAWAMAQEMGVELLDREDYALLQSLVPCDTKTSSWLATEESIRKLWGAIFGDRRYDTVFVYHNGADSYYAARWWRGKVVF